MKNCENWSCWKDCIELGLKVVFVGVFTWGVMSAVCCSKSCSSSAQTTCCKAGAVDTVCAPGCQKDCCKK
tara:strand:- start:919 stop:1128 length:210 start_codon:yes stop_codon:yes gene_type:complete